MQKLLGIAFILLFAFLTRSPNIFAQSFGINSELESREIADKVQELGVGWVRVTAYWCKIEKSKGEFNWSELDHKLRLAGQRDLKVYVLIHCTPRWANGDKTETHPPIKTEDWTDFVKAITHRYSRHSALGGFGMWNEPNLSGFWVGSRTEYVEKILIPGYQAVKSVDPEILVGAPELAHHWTSRGRWKLWDILKAANGNFDVVTVHYYPDSSVDFDDYLDRWIKPHVQEKPLWVTEIGEKACRDSRDSEKKQTEEYHTFLRVFQERSSWFQLIFPYRIWDPEDSCSNGNGFGLTYGSPLLERPAYGIYRNSLRTQDQ